MNNINEIEQLTPEKELINRLTAENNALIRFRIKILGELGLIMAKDSEKLAIEKIRALIKFKLQNEM